MALSRLLDAIERDARAELHAIDEASRGEADAIARAASEDASGIEAEIVTAAQAAAAAARDATLGEARLQAARIIRDAREQAFLATLDALRARLSVLRDDDGYQGVLTALVAECRRALPDGRTLRIDPRDATLMRGWGVGLVVEPTLSTWGGCELDDGHGRVVKNTLEHRMAAAEPSLRQLLRASADLPEGLS